MVAQCFQLHADYGESQSIRMADGCLYIKKDKYVNQKKKTDICEM